MCIPWLRSTTKSMADTFEWVFNILILISIRPSEIWKLCNYVNIMYQYSRLTRTLWGWQRLEMWWLDPKESNMRLKNFTKYTISNCPLVLLFLRWLKQRWEDRWTQHERNANQQNLRGEKTSANADGFIIFNSRCLAEEFTVKMRIRLSTLMTQMTSFSQRNKPTDSITGNVSRSNSHQPLITNILYYGIS